MNSNGPTPDIWRKVALKRLKLYMEQNRYEIIEPNYVSVLALFNKIIDTAILDQPLSYSQWLTEITIIGSDGGPLAVMPPWDKEASTSISTILEFLTLFSLMKYGFAATAFVSNESTTYAGFPSAYFSTFLENLRIGQDYKPTLSLAAHKKMVLGHRTSAHSYFKDNPQRLQKFE